MNAPPLRIAFPCLHPSLSPCRADGVVFLDPGLASPAQQNETFLLESLPLDHRTARACLAEMLAFGEQFQKPGDMVYYSVAGMENYYSGTAMDYRDELEALSVKEERPDTRLAEMRLAAQRLLLLAWHLEEKRLELDEAASTLNSLKDRFNSSVQSVEGEDETVDDPEMARLVGQLVPDDLDLNPAAGSLEWRRLAEAVLILAPADAELALCDMEVARELGVQDAPMAIPGWQLAGQEGPDSERPWLDRDVLCYPLICLPAADESQSESGVGSGDGTGAPQ